ncbi:hypothetical protein BKA24_000850 [Microbacterium marinum]|uniref:Uncharacterized protein n=1 Tax=Microbacterium marinum TaxID=421115 RepID=A0A7W7FH83_9MICO|nr:hypothetical protein [Microbacterium marinum]
MRSVRSRKVSSSTGVGSRSSARAARILADEIGRLRRHQIIALAYADTSRREAAGRDAETLAAIDAIASRVASVEKQLTDLRALTQRIADALGVITPIGDISVSQVTKNRIGLDDQR